MASLQTANAPAGYLQAGDESGRPEPITAILDELTGTATRAQSFTAANGAAIAVLRGDVLVCCARTGAIGPAVGAILSQQGVAGTSVRTNKEVRCDDTESDARVDGPECRAWNARSILAIPVHEKDAATGVILVFSTSPSAFTHVHLAILKTLADQLKGLREKTGASPTAPTPVPTPPPPPAPRRDTQIAAAPIPTPPPAPRRDTQIAAAPIPTPPPAPKPEIPVAAAPIPTPLSAPKPELQTVTTPPPAPAPRRETLVSMAPTPLTLPPVFAPEKEKKSVPEKKEATPDRAPTAEFEIRVVVPSVTEKIAPPPLAKPEATVVLSVPQLPAVPKPPAAPPKAEVNTRPKEIITPPFTPMAHPPKPVSAPVPAVVPAEPVETPRKKRPTELLPAAADPIDLSLGTPAPRRRPSADATAFGMAPFAMTEVHSGSRFSLLMVAAVVLTVGFGGWGAYRMVRKAPSRTVAVPQTATAQTTATPSANTPVAVTPVASTVNTPPATQAVTATKGPTHETNQSPKEPEASKPEPRTVEVAETKTKIPVVNETVASEKPAEVTSTVLRTPAKSDIVEAPKIATSAPAEVVPVMAAPVAVVQTAARSTGATPAQVLIQTKPVYPMAAKMMHAQGVVTLNVEIGKDGKVDQVKWVSGNTLFKETAMAAVRDWKYKPATLDGQPTESTQDVVLKFAPQ